MYYPDLLFWLIDVKPGSQTGINNGFQMILDAETYDYGTPTMYFQKNFNTYKKIVIF